MRTNIVLDDKLVEEAFSCSEARTKKDLVDEALRTLIAKNKRKSLLDIKGKIQFDPTYDYKKVRAGE